MDTEEFEILKKMIEETMIKLESLQKQYIKETGRHYMMPIYLEKPKEAE